MKNFQFKIQQEVLDLGVKIKGVRIHGINNTVYFSSLNDYIDVHVKRLLENKVFYFRNFVFPSRLIIKRWCIFNENRRVHFSRVIHHIEYIFNERLR